MADFHFISEADAGNVVEGDIFEVTRGVIFHQTCCSGSLGDYGTALKTKFPLQFEVHDESLRKVGVNWDRMLGHARVGANGDIAIAHCFVRYGTEEANMAVVGEAIHNAAKSIRNTPLAQLPVYVPYRMGYHCGLGDWAQCQAILRRLFPKLTIVKLKPFASFVGRAG